VPVPKSLSRRRRSLLNHHPLLVAVPYSSFCSWWYVLDAFAPCTYVLTYNNDTNVVAVIVPAAELLEHVCIPTGVP